MRHLPTNTPQAFSTEILERKAKLYAEVMNVDEINEAEDIADTQDRTPSYFTPAGAAYLEIRREIKRRAKVTYEQFSQHDSNLRGRAAFYAKYSRERSHECAIEEIDRLHMQHPEYSQRLLQEMDEAAEEYMREQEHAEQYAHLYGSIDENRNEQPTA